MTKKIILGISVFLLGFLLGNFVKAADLNGYTAEYECRAGGPNCNVDVATLTAQACQQTITTATSPTGDWSAVNWSNNVICIDKGDHTGRGTLTVSTSGTSGTRKVLRYYRSGDTDDDPWDQSAGDKAKVANLAINANYWIFHRLTFPAVDAGSDRILCNTGSGCDGLIFNRLLVEGMESGFSNSYSGMKFRDGDNITLQNSVLRNSWGLAGAEPMAITPTGGTGANFHIVNNELYDWSAHTIQVGNNSHPSIPGVVIENNDIYESGSLYVAGGLSRMKNTISMKSDSTSGNPTKIIQNRIWGVRSSSQSGVNINSDLGACMYGSVGDTDTLGSYYLIQNNICMDAQYGVTCLNGNCDHTSVIGNIFYNLQKFYSSSGSSAVEGSNLLTSEIYFNTIISVPDEESIHADGTNADIKCNVIIDAVNMKGPKGSGTSVDNNVYYSVSGTKLDSTKIDVTINTRANSTAYSQDDIIRTTATPPADGTAGDFLYKVTVAGTSAGSPPSYTTILGGTNADGTMTVRAIRGPYSFYRKLRTTPEIAYIPYVNRDTAAPEVGNCPAGYASTADRGIDNTQP